MTTDTAVERKPLAEEAWLSYQRRETKGESRTTTEPVADAPSRRAPTSRR